MDCAFTIYKLEVNINIQKNPLDNETIEIFGAREHNLKNIDVTLPRYKLIVITGISGSGKSSLAFDTIYAEGQRRYVESLSSFYDWAMKRPRFEEITGNPAGVVLEEIPKKKRPRPETATWSNGREIIRKIFHHGFRGAW